MRKFDLGNGHTITVEDANRGYADDYKVMHYFDGRLYTPTPEYYTKDCLEWEYDIAL